jgi:iron complex outermembrane receptor protein
VTAFTVDTPVNETPKFTYSLSGSYMFHLDGSRSLRASLDWRGVGRRPECSPLGSCTLPAYGLLGGRLEFTPSETSPWSIALWGTNLLDARYYISKNFGGNMGIDRVLPGRPR